MSIHNFELGIEMLQNNGISIPECHSIDEYYTALESILPIYANEPGKMRWIYGEMRMVKIKDYNESGTELQKMHNLCQIANRYLMNRSFYLQFFSNGVNDKRKRDLYNRLNTIEVISPPKNYRCSKCQCIDGKKYRIIEDIMGGIDELYNNTPNFKIPHEVVTAMDSCTTETGCTLLLS